MDEEVFNKVQKSLQQLISEMKNVTQSPQVMDKFCILITSHFAEYLTPIFTFLSSTQTLLQDKYLVVSLIGYYNKKYLPKIQNKNQQQISNSLEYHKEQQDLSNTFNSFIGLLEKLMENQTVPLGCKQIAVREYMRIVSYDNLIQISKAINKAEYYFHNVHTVYMGILLASSILALENKKSEGIINKVTFRLLEAISYSMTEICNLAYYGKNMEHNLTPDYHDKIVIEGLEQLFNCLSGIYPGDNRLRALCDHQYMIKMLQIFIQSIQNCAFNDLGYKNSRIYLKWFFMIIAQIMDKNSRLIQNSHSFLTQIDNLMKFILLERLQFSVQTEGYLDNQEFLMMYGALVNLYTEYLKLNRIPDNYSGDNNQYRFHYDLLLVTITKLQIIIRNKINFMMTELKISQASQELIQYFKLIGDPHIQIEAQDHDQDQNNVDVYIIKLVRKLYTIDPQIKVNIDNFIKVPDYSGFQDKTVRNFKQNTVLILYVALYPLLCSDIPKIDQISLEIIKYWHQLEDFNLFEGNNNNNKQLRLYQRLLCINCLLFYAEQIQFCDLEKQSHSQYLLTVWLNNIKSINHSNYQGKDQRIQLYNSLTMLCSFLLLDKYLQTIRIAIGQCQNSELTIRITGILTQISYIFKYNSDSQQLLDYQYDNRLALQVTLSKIIFQNIQSFQNFPTPQNSPKLQQIIGFLLSCYNNYSNHQNKTIIQLDMLNIFLQVSRHSHLEHVLKGIADWIVSNQYIIQNTNQGQEYIKSQYNDHVLGILSNIAKSSKSGSDFFNHQSCIKLSQIAIETIVKEDLRIEDCQFLYIVAIFTKNGNIINKIFTLLFKNICNRIHSSKIDQTRDKKQEDKIHTFMLVILHTFIDYQNFRIDSNSIIQIINNLLFYFLNPISQHNMQSMLLGKYKLLFVMLLNQDYLRMAFFFQKSQKINSLNNCVERFISWLFIQQQDYQILYDLPIFITQSLELLQNRIPSLEQDNQQCQSIKKFSSKILQKSHFVIGGVILGLDRIYESCRYSKKYEYNIISSYQFFDKKNSKNLHNQPAQSVESKIYWIEEIIRPIVDKKLKQLFEQYPPFMDVDQFASFRNFCNSSPKYQNQMKQKNMERWIQGIIKNYVKNLYSGSFQKLKQTSKFKGSTLSDSTYRVIISVKRQSK